MFAGAVDVGGVVPIGRVGDRSENFLRHHLREAENRVSAASEARGFIEARKRDLARLAPPRGPRASSEIDLAVSSSAMRPSFSVRKARNITDARCR